MDQFYTWEFTFTVSSMLTTILRLGPLVLLQIGFVAASFIVWMFGQMPPCYYYTLGYLAIVTFLIEMIASLRMMKDQNSLRREYLCHRVREPKGVYICRLIWDNLNIILVIMLLYYSLIVDGISLSSIADSEHPQQSSDCQFTLFSLCLFREFQKALHSNIRDNLMVMWLLYAAGVFLTSLICVIFNREYYQYCSSIASNRKMLEQFGTINETLLDCQVYSVRSLSVISEEISEQIGVCSICLHRIVDSDPDPKYPQTVIRLRCSHLFHKECIDKWLSVKDHCPFRCSGKD